MNPVDMISIMSRMLYQVVGTTAECDSPVLCEALLPRVPLASSIHGAGHTLQPTSLVYVTTGEKNQMVLTQ